MIYVLWRQPPMYDGFRHFLFIAPPLFVLAGIALGAVFQKFPYTWLKVALPLALLLPGLLADVRLHPYQYTYYNQFASGTGAAAQRFETDYWLTCYKDAVETLDSATEGQVNLYVRREYYIAAYYAPEEINVLDFKLTALKPGDFVLYHSRAFPNLQRNAATNNYFLRIERDGAIFCEIREQ